MDNYTSLFIKIRTTSIFIFCVRLLSSNYIHVNLLYFEHTILCPSVGTLNGARVKDYKPLGKQFKIVSLVFEEA